MSNNSTNSTIPILIRQSDKKEYQLCDRLTTIGSSPQSKIIVAGSES